MSAGLTLTAVAITRGKRHLVDGLSLAAPPGTLVAIIGVAGSGKSAVLDAIAGHGRVDAGTVDVDGRVAYVSQAHDLIPTLTALENVALAALAAGATPDDSWQRAAHWLDRLGLPAAAQANLAEELSGGQHQRVALARALTADAALSSPMTRPASWTKRASSAPSMPSARCSPMVQSSWSRQASRGCSPPPG